MMTSKSINHNTLVDGQIYIVLTGGGALRTDALARSGSHFASLIRGGLLASAPFAALLGAGALGLIGGAGAGDGLLKDLGLLGGAGGGLFRRLGFLKGERGGDAAGVRIGVRAGGEAREEGC
mmetsp:Transcript_54782/g.90782  ORF Transcript_54782/g.90782 Transcript_54782/m.90782 type:complete len:122 (+) Transcript_54782:105-470(+)